MNVQIFRQFAATTAPTSLEGTSVPALLEREALIMEVYVCKINSNGNLLHAVFSV
jgi:hypothetical protein